MQNTAGKTAGVYVENKVQMLLKTKNEALAYSSLAKLRKGIGKMPGELPELWEMTLEGLPLECMSHNGNPTSMEWSVYIALTMFALHQQGKDRIINPMHIHGVSLGTAMRRMVKSDDDMARVKRRLDSLITASSFTGISYYLRALVNLLRRADIPLDYAMLARDLYYLQIPGSAERVKLRWGQDFYKVNSLNENEGSQEGKNENEYEYE